MRSSLLTRLAAILIAVQLPVAVVAAFLHDDEPGSDDAEVVEGGPDYLAAAAERTAAATHYRFDMSMRFDAPGIDELDGLEAAIGSGAQAGSRSHFVIDQSSMMEELGVDDVGGMSMEVITDGTTQYLRAPLFATMFDELGGVPPEFQALADLGDGWGRIDLASVGAATGVPGELMGQSSMDPQGAIDIIRAAAGHEEPAGTAEVRGTPVSLYEAKVTFDELMGGGGMTFDDMRAYMPELPAGIDEDDIDAMFEAIGDTPMSVSVGIDGDGLVRRTTMTFGEELFEAIAEAAGEPGGFPGEISMSQTIDFFDFGDQTIVIEPPPIEQTVDITAWALEMADGFS